MVLRLVELQIHKNVSGISLHNVAGSRNKLIGTAYIPFTLGQQNITQLFAICKNITQPVVLGRDFLTNNNVIMR